MSMYYPAIITFDGRFLKVTFPEFKDLVCDEYTTMHESIHFAEEVLTEYLNEQYIKNGNLPNPLSIESIVPIKDEIARILICCKVIDNRAVIGKAMIVSVRDLATAKEVEYTKLLSNAGKLMLDRDCDISDNINSFLFFRRLMGLTNTIKTTIHTEIEQKYADPKWKKIVNWVTRSFGPTDKNWEVSVEVYNRLLLRYALLRDAERLERRYGAHASFSTATNAINKKENLFVTNEHEVESDADGEVTVATGNNPDLRAYKLATTDVFVEKAIAYLEVDSDRYRFYGKLAYILAVFIILGGFWLSLVTNFPNGILEPPPQTPDLKDWKMVFSNFSRLFTLYGMLVLLAVGLWRFGKAMLDQAERLRERRHALRQGRLFVHLNDGECKIEDLEKAFAWNMSKGNAFGDMQVEASAPWGSLFKDALKTIKETFGRGNNSGR